MSETFEALHFLADLKDKMFVGTLSSHLSFLKALKSHQAPAEFRRR